MSSIVVGYDGSPAARRALERAADLAKNGGPVTVVAAVAVIATSPQGPVPMAQPDRLVREEALAEAGAFLAKRGIKARQVEGFGDAANVIVEEAKDVDADLVIVGSRGIHGIKRLLLGSVSRQVVTDAPCDVLVVR